MRRQTQTSTDPVRLLTISASAAWLGCSDNHVYRLIETGVLPAVDIAQPGARRSKTRVRSDHLAAYVESRTRTIKSSGDAA